MSRGDPRKVAFDSRKRAQPEFSQADFNRALKMLAKAKVRRECIAGIDFGAPVGREA